MAKIENILELALTSGGTVNVPVKTNLSVGSFNGHIARITGAQTLSSGFTVAALGSPVTGTVVTTLWEASCIPGANSITIFGLTIPPHLGSKRFMVFSEYRKGSWVSFLYVGLGQSDVIIDEYIVGRTIDLKAKVKAEVLGDVLVYGESGVPAFVNIGTDGYFLIGDSASGSSARAISGHATVDKLGALTISNAVITAAMMVNATITGAKIAAGTITASNLEGNANKYTRDFVLSFKDSDEVGVLNFTICEDCTIDEINVTVLSPAADDDATLIYKDDGGTELTDSQTDITTSHTLGNIVSTTPTANNVFSAGDNFKIEMSKTTKTSCKVNVSLCITKT